METPKPEQSYYVSRRSFVDPHVKTGQNRLYDVYDFDYKDGELLVVKTGVRNPQEMVNESRVETISEIIKRMPGRNAIQKLGAAVSNGLVTPNVSGSFTDISGVGSSVVEAQEQLQKARAQASALPKDLVDRDQDFKKMLSQLDSDKIIKYVSEHFKTSTTQKEGESKQ